jgi:hypothetical protein
VTPSDDQNLLRLLEECLARCDVALRCESLVSNDGIGSSRGGLCTVNDRRVVFVDPRAPLPERLDVLASALASLDLDDVFLPPAVRQAVERASRSAAR